MRKNAILAWMMMGACSVLSLGVRAENVYDSDAYDNLFQESIIRRPERWTDPPYNIGACVLNSKQIKLTEFPGAFNPSLIKVPEGFLLIFRHCPNNYKLWISNIGVVLLNNNFEQISKPTLLKTRHTGDIIPSQAEDARIFSHNDKLYLIYNDNMEYECPSIYERRDMHIAELTYADGQFTLSDPVLLFHEKKYDKTNWQKNWVPFSWNESILLSYSILPHEILCPDLSTGECNVFCETANTLQWKWGTLRGGTPAILIDGEYLAFFHSSTITKSISSRGRDMWHYYMGAYTFEAKPPFAITKMTSSPIVGDKFYTQSSFHKRVVFPGGFVFSEPNIYLAYGKDDSEIWIATIDYNRLKDVLFSIKK